jgi:two-component system sensor histidine kinase RegB
MNDTGLHYLFNLQARGDWVRLRTLVTLRWMAIAGQVVALLVASHGMGFQLPLAACALLISASASVNVVAHLIYPTVKRLTERGTLMSLFFDLAQLVTLLSVTGGLNNPFAVLVIAPVTISATALRLQSTLWLGIAGMASVTVMSSFYLPLVQADGTVFEAPELYRTGVSVALAIANAFLSVTIAEANHHGSVHQRLAAVVNDLGLDCRWPCHGRGEVGPQQSENRQEPRR